MMTTGISLSVATMTFFIDVNNTVTSSFTYVNNAVTWILNGSFLMIGDDDDGKSTECCHDDNYVLCRHEHWHWFSCLSLDFLCSIPVRIVYRRHCLPLLAYCPFLCLFWLQMWECILSSWICGLLSVQTVRWRCWVDDTLLVALNQCLQSCCADHSPVWCWVIWITYRRHMHLIERWSYHQRCLRAILNINWSDFVTNIEVLEMAKVTSIEAMLLKTQLRWAGHVSRMWDNRLPMIVL